MDLVTLSELKTYWDNMIKTWIITCKDYGMKIKLIDNKNIKKRGERQKGRRNIGRNTIPHTTLNQWWRALARFNNTREKQVRLITQA